MSKPFVRVVGVALALSACHKPTAPPQPEPPILRNPPPPEEPTSNPPDPGLPTWDQVESGHPEGATNPPRPVLIVSQDTKACFKDWEGGMMPPSPEVSATGGRVVKTQAEAAELGGTQVVCPEGEPDKLLAAHAEWASGGKKPK